MKPISDKRRGDLVVRADVVGTVKRRDRYRCQAFYKVRDVQCGGELDVHEIIPRSAWPDGWLVVDNCVCLCRRHHEWVDANPDDAHEVGLHGYAHERPDGHAGIADTTAVVADKMAKQPPKVVISLRLTGDEYSRLKARASGIGASVNAFAHHLVVDG